MTAADCGVRRAGAAVSARRLPSLLFVAAFFVVRLPFLLSGSGADTDAYRVVLAGRYLWSEGAYLPSRLPGYPLHEAPTALLLWGGPFLTNLATSVIAFVGVLIFDRIVVTLRVPGRGWLLVAMGFTPWLIVTSTETLDYHWALTPMLGAYLATIRRRYTLAGLLLGVAAGCRITAAVFLLPLAVLMLVEAGRERRWREAARRIALLGGVAAAVTILAYLPVLRVYGTAFWNYAPSSVSPDVIIQMVGQRALGAVGALTTLVVLAVSWRRLLTVFRLLRADPHVLLWLLTVVTYALLYLRLPVDVGYLVPVFPFAFLLVAKVLARWALITIVIATLVSGLIDLDIQGVHNLDPAIAARELRPSWRVATLPHDLRARHRWQRFSRRIVAADVPPHSVVLTLGAFPDVAVLHWGQLRYAIVERDLTAVSMLSDNGSLRDSERDIVYLAVSEPRILDRFRAQGYRIYVAEPDGPDWRVRLRPVDTRP